MKTFSERVVEAARKIPKGKVTTYGRIALASGGGAMASQSITAILGKAYNGGITDIPFHRIVYADGHVWIDDAHAKKRLALYKQEGIELTEKGVIKDFRNKLYEFK
jgi:alkylated DNA nucleotide flippase Atl1